MSIFTRPLLVAALATAASLFTACSDKDKAEAPAPADPAPTFRLGSYFDFTTITPAGGNAHSGFGTTHSALDIKGRVVLHPQVLALDFAAGADDVHFEVDRPRLSPDWLGTYALRCRNRPTEPIFASYVSHRNNGSSIYRFTDFALNLTGNVTITAYDAKRQLVSGHYEVRAPEQLDPTNTTSTTSPKCTIILAGDFDNVKVKTQ